MIITCPKCNGLIEIDRRTNPQNKYLHLCFKIISEHTGYNLEQVKILMKQNFNLYEDFGNKKTGETYRRYFKTSEMSKKEMTEFIENVYLFCISHNLNVLTPQEYFLLNKLSLKNDS